MPINLEDRARDQQDELILVVTQVNDALAGARDEQSRRHSDPTSVTQANWATEFGATQHTDIARQAVAASLRDEERIRADLAAVSNPADTASFEAELRAVLILHSQLAVELRFALERSATVAAHVDELEQLSRDAQNAASAADEAVRWGKEQNDFVATLRTAVTTSPVADVPAIASGLAQALTDAQTRIGELLSFEDARQRSFERFEEAAAKVANAAAHDEFASATLAQLDAEAAPLRAASAAATGAYLAAQSALAKHVGSAARQIEPVESTLLAIAALPDLSTAQSDVLDPPDTTALTEAVGFEAALGSALDDLGDAQRLLDDEQLKQLVDDPTADVAQAQSDLNDLITATVTPARDNYDPAAQAELDGWEVEVPPSLWVAMHDLLRAEATIDELSGTPGDDLVAELDAAEIVLESALDAEEIAAQRRLSVALEAAARKAALAGAQATEHDRHMQFLRGDGAAGRFATEL